MKNIVFCWAFGACIVIAPDAAMAVEGIPPCDKNHFILDEPCAVLPEGTLTRLPDLPRSHGVDYAATMLPGKRILVAGGYDVASRKKTAIADLYDPASGMWTPVGDMNGARSELQMVALADGRVFVLGGDEAFSPSGGLEMRGRGEIFDPATSTWSLTDPMLTPRWGHTVAALPSGEILVVGGQDAGWMDAGATEIYDPVTGKWREGPTLAQPRFSPSVTLLPDGRVLILGGPTDDEYSYASAPEIYDAKTARMGFAGPVGFATTAIGFSTTLLADGRVLIAGGQKALSFWKPPRIAYLTLDASAIYDPVENSWSDGPSLNHERYGQNAVATPRGILVFGGVRDATQPPTWTTEAVPSAEFYSIEQGTWTELGPVDPVLQEGVVTPLSGGEYLVDDAGRVYLYAPR